MWREAGWLLKKSKGLGSILAPRQVPHLRGHSLSQSGSSCLLELPEDDEMTALEGWRPKVFFITLLFSCHPIPGGREAACLCLPGVPTVHGCLCRVYHATVRRSIHVV